ncbi:MAG TPA: hypothetical protein VMU18_13660 [Rhodoblastus sp.]|nr:hypothetical protein [Rhodoblastus sp.]
MGILKRILRAICEDDGAPSLYSGLVVGAPLPVQGERAARAREQSQHNKAAAAVRRN